MVGFYFVCSYFDLHFYLFFIFLLLLLFKSIEREIIIFGAIIEQACFFFNILINEMCDCIKGEILQVERRVEKDEETNVCFLLLLLSLLLHNAKKNTNFCTTGWVGHEES